MEEMTEENQIPVDVVDELRVQAIVLGDKSGVFGRAAAEIVRLRTMLSSIDQYSVNTVRTNSKDRDDWIDDVAFMGKLARGH